MDLAAYVATIDQLRARPFPGQRVRAGAVESGPGFHVADLEVSEEFWESGPDRWEEVLEDFEAVCEALVGVLARRWGEPEVVDLMGHLERSMEGEAIRPPLDLLCTYVPEVYGWRVEGRWIALGVGQWDRELPFQLVVAVGEEDVG